MHPVMTYADVDTDVDTDASAGETPDGDANAEQLPIPLRIGEAGVCWVCERTYDFDVTDFEADGPHAACAETAVRMDVAFREAARRRTMPTVLSGAVDWMRVQW